MKQETGKVISIRLIYVILFFVILIVGITQGIKYFNNNEVVQIAESNQENMKQENINIASRKSEQERATSRGENLSRKQENNLSENTEVLEENNQEQEKTVENIVNAADGIVIEEKKTISISEVKISQNMDLTVRTGLSREDFIKLMAGVKQDTSGFFKQNAGTIYDLCEEYSLNEIFFCGLISAESGWNIAQNHRATHNYISLMSNGKLIYYPSVESGLREAARKLHTNYLTKGGKFYYGKTLSAVKTKFCPASSTWVSLVYGRMKQIIK
jgi:hypothetical protein